MLANKTNSSEFQLVSAIKKNDVAKVKELLSTEHIDVNSKNLFGQTALHVASSVNLLHRNEETLNLLVDKGANVNAQDDLGETPLHFLIENGHPKAVKLLLKLKNTKVDVKDKDGKTPLALAALLGNDEMVRILVINGANVNQLMGVCGPKIFHWACFNCNAKIIECLIKYGAEVITPGPFKSLLLFQYLNFLNDKTKNTDDAKQTLQLLLDSYNLEKVKFDIYSGTNCFNFMNECTRKIFLKQIAKLQQVNIFMHSTFTIALSESKPNNIKFFRKCNEELLMAKNDRLKNSWLTYFNLLVDDERKLKNYAGNRDLVEDLNYSDCLKKFPIYGDDMMENMKKGIEIRKIFDESAEKLSDCLQIFNPSHLIIRNILDCLNSVDYQILIQED